MEKSLDDKATQQHVVNDEQTTRRRDSLFNTPGGQYADKSLLAVPTNLTMNPGMDIEMDEALQKELFGSTLNSPVTPPGSELTAPKSVLTDSASNERKGLPDKTEGMNDGLDNAKTISQPDSIDFQEPQLNPATNDGGLNSTNANDQMEIDHSQSAAQSSDVQTLQPNPLAGAAAATTHGQMPPPAAPASMLTQLRPSTNTRSRINDRPHIECLPFICRLISASVILFRMGRAVEAQKLGQFTIDIAGQQLWDQELPTYLNAPPLPIDSVDSATRLLREAVKYMRSKHRPSSDFLDGMLYAWS